MPGEIAGERKTWHFTTPLSRRLEDSASVGLQTRELYSHGFCPSSGLGNRR